MLELADVSGTGDVSGVQLYSYIAEIKPNHGVEYATFINIHAATIEDARAIVVAEFPDWTILKLYLLGPFTPHGTS